LVDDPEVCRSCPPHPLERCLAGRRGQRRPVRDQLGRNGIQALTGRSLRVRCWILASLLTVPEGKGRAIAEQGTGSLTDLPIFAPDFMLSIISLYFFCS